MDCAELTELLLEAEEAVTSAISTTHSHKARLAAAANGAASARIPADHGGGRRSGGHGGGGEAHGGEAAAHGPGAVQSADAGHGGHEAAGRGACSAGAGRSDGNGVAPAAAVVAGGWRTSGSEFLGCQVGGEAIVRMRVCVYACATCAGADHATAMFEASSATARYAAALSCCDVCRRSATA